MYTRVYMKLASIHYCPAYTKVYKYNNIQLNTWIYSVLIHQIFRNNNLISQAINVCNLYSELKSWMDISSALPMLKSGGRITLNNAEDAGDPSHVFRDVIILPLNTSCISRKHTFPNQHCDSCRLMSLF